MLDYETCKKLKDAGFPQGYGDAYCKGEFAKWDTFHDILDCNGGDCDGQHCYIPSLEELIEACEGSIDCIENLGRGGRKWSVWNGETDVDRADGFGRTPSEAVANLYLELNKK